MLKGKACYELQQALLFYALAVRGFESFSQRIPGQAGMPYWHLL